MEERCPGAGFYEGFKRQETVKYNCKTDVTPLFWFGQGAIWVGSLRSMFYDFLFLCVWPGVVLGQRQLSIVVVLSAPFFNKEKMCAYDAAPWSSPSASSDNMKEICFLYVWNILGIFYFSS